METLIDRIKQKVPITTVLEWHGLQPARETPGKWWIICPVHGDTDPSLVVHPNRDRFRCYGGCDRSGDQIDLVQLLQNCSAKEAISWLAKKADITTESRAATKEEKELALGKKVLSTAWAYYQQCLTNNKSARSFLHERGIVPTTIEKFGIGYSSDPRGLVEKLDQCGFSPSLGIKFGVLATNSRGKAFDRMHGRIVFPIFKNYQPVGFAGRVLKVDPDIPKYVNTPQTRLFTKSELLYGLPQSRIPIRQIKSAILVEGYFDVLTLYQKGIQNVAGIMGTATTCEQLELIQKLAPAVTFLFDGDKGGISALPAALDLALDLDLIPRVSFLPSGEDPDTFGRRESTQAINDLLERAEPGLKHRIELLMKEDIPQAKEWIRTYLGDEVINQLVRGKLIADIFGRDPSELGNVSARSDSILSDPKYACPKCRQSKTFSATFAGYHELRQHRQMGCWFH